MAWTGNKIVADGSRTVMLAGLNPDGRMRLNCYSGFLLERTSMIEPEDPSDKIKLER
jgi:hypothetical protein